MPSYEYHCNGCLHEFTEVVSYESRDTLGVVKCPHCSDWSLTRHFPSPRVLKASWPDGHKRPGWSDVKEISKLKQEQIRHSVTTQKGREARERIRKQMQALSGSAEKQILDKKPQEDLVFDKVDLKSKKQEE